MINWSIVIFGKWSIIDRLFFFLWKIYVTTIYNWQFFFLNKDTVKYTINSRCKKSIKFDCKSSLTDRQISHEVASTNIIVDVWKNFSLLYCWTACYRNLVTSNVDTYEKITKLNIIHKNFALSISRSDSLSVEIIELFASISMRLFSNLIKDSIVDK